jgi:hypothetical protein
MSKSVLDSDLTLELVIQTPITDTEVVGEDDKSALKYDVIKVKTGTVRLDVDSFALQGLKEGHRADNLFELKFLDGTVIKIEFSTAALADKIMQLVSDRLAKLESDNV